MDVLWECRCIVGGRLGVLGIKEGAVKSMEETPAVVETEAERAERQRQEERVEKIDAEITVIVNKLRDLAIRMDRLGKGGGNSASADMRRCVNDFWEKTESGYQRKTMTTERAIKLIEKIPNVPKTMSVWHKKRLGDVISGNIDAIFTCVSRFLSTNGSLIHDVKALAAVQRRQDEERQALERQALQKQKPLENARELPDTLENARELPETNVSSDHAPPTKERTTYMGMKLFSNELEARRALVITLWAMKKEYERRVASFLDSWREHVWDGKILKALWSLTLYQQGWYIDDPDIRGKDTYLWCLALHDCTKYLACDDRYKDKSFPTKDDRFKGVYQKNYYFRRRWVAFLRQIMQYVELINTGARAKPYASVEALQAEYRAACRDGVDVHTQRAVQHRDLKGYDWARMKKDLDTAQEKIDAEPESARTWANVKGQRAHVEDLLDELHRLNTTRCGCREGLSEIESQIHSGGGSLVVP